MKQYSTLVTSIQFTQIDEDDMSSRACFFQMDLSVPSHPEDLDVQLYDAARNNNKGKFWSLLAQGAKPNGYKDGVSRWID